MGKFAPNKIEPLPGEAVFKVGFRFKENSGRYEAIGKYDPQDYRQNRRHVKIGCLTIVAQNDSSGNIVAGVSAFLNSEKGDPFQTSAGTNISRVRLQRNIKRGINFNVPKLYGNNGDNTLFPVLTELPKYVIEVMGRKFEKSQAVAAKA